MKTLDVLQTVDLMIWDYEHRLDARLIDRMHELKRKLEEELKA